MGDIAPLVTLEGVNGELFTFSSKDVVESIVLQPGAKGLEMPTWDVQTDDYPALDGSFPRASRASSREIFLPLMAYGSTRYEMKAALRSLEDALDPSLIPTTLLKLSVAEPDASGNYETPREIDVYYANGLEGDEGSENGLVYNKFGLVLRATDPFFRAPADVTHTFSAFTGEVINNPGKVRVFPTWTIEGPAQSPFSLVRAATAYNPAQSLLVEDLTLTAGQVLTIVTQPGKLKVTTDFGPDVGWSALAANPTFWTLDPGDNTVSVSGLTVTPTSVSLSFRPKYMGM